MQRIPYILDMPVHAQINYISVFFVHWPLAVKTAFKFIMAAFEMSVRDSLCKTSTKSREKRGTGESWDG